MQRYGKHFVHRRDRLRRWNGWTRKSPVSRVICRLLAYALRYMEEPFTEINEENIEPAVDKIKSAVLNILSR